MSQENVERVERMLELFHAGDAEGALACFSADVVTDVVVRADTPTGHGREELARITGSWLSAWETWHEEINETRDLGEWVLVMATQRGLAKTTGIEVVTQYAMLYEIRDGELSRMIVHRSAAEALEAAGLSE
jgi:ketosteroid isomerase-like protein